MDRPAACDLELCGVGFFFVMDSVHSIRNIVTMAVPMIIIAGMAINAISYATLPRSTNGRGSGCRRSHIAILPHITQNSYVAVNGCFDARYVLFLYHGIPLSVFYKKDEARPFDRVFAIVYDQPKAGCGTEPVSETLRLYGPDPSLVDMTTLKPINQSIM